SAPSDGNTEAVGQLSSNSAPLLAKSAKTKQTQRVISHHAARHSSARLGTGALPAPPPISDDDYVQRWFTYAFVRSPTTSESGYWDDMLRAAYAHAQSSLVMTTR